jgi:hypothetical protein
MTSPERPPQLGWTAPVWGPGIGPDGDWFRWLVVDGGVTPYYLPLEPTTGRPPRWSLYLAHGAAPAAHSDPCLADRVTLPALERWIAGHAGDLP